MSLIIKTLLHLLVPRHRRHALQLWPTSHKVCQALLERNLTFSSWLCTCCTIKSSATKFSPPEQCWIKEEKKQKKVISVPSPLQEPGLGSLAPPTDLWAPQCQQPAPWAQCTARKPASQTCCTAWWCRWCLAPAGKCPSSASVPGGCLSLCPQTPSCPAAVQGAGKGRASRSDGPCETLGTLLSD